MDVCNHLTTLLVGIALHVCMSCCQLQGVVDVMNLERVEFHHLDTPHLEYICMGVLEINFANENELLLGVCTPTIEDLSAAIGTLAISELEKKNITDANLLYGSLNKTEPKNTDLNWDGTGVNARIKRPEQFYQTIDEIRFIDDRSCARKINRTSGNVTTVLGKCASTTLDIVGAVLSACYGMTYFEDKEMWVFSVVNDGLYVYKEGGSSPRLILHQDHLSSVISSSSRQLQRDIDEYGNRNNLVWNKIKTGINYYNFTDILPDSGNITFTENFVRYISATGKSPIDTTARRHNESDEALGSSDADLSISLNGKVLAIGDISLDRLFFLDISTKDDNTGEIKPLQAVCVKNSADVEDNLANCTFAAISAAGWVNASTIITYEQKLGVFRKFTVSAQEALPMPTTTTTEPTTTTTEPTTTDPTTAASTTTSTTTEKPTSTAELTDSTTGTDVNTAAIIKSSATATTPLATSTPHPTTTMQMAATNTTTTMQMAATNTTMTPLNSTLRPSTTKELPTFTSTESPPGLAGWAIVLIVICCVLLVAAIIAIVSYFNPCNFNLIINIKSKWKRNNRIIESPSDIRLDSAVLSTETSVTVIAESGSAPSKKASKEKKKKSKKLPGLREGKKPVATE